MTCENCIEWQAKLIRSEDRRIQEQIAYRVNAAADKYGVVPTGKEDLHARILKMGEWKDEKGKLILMKSGLPVMTQNEDFITPEIAVRLQRDLGDETKHLFGDVPEQAGSSGANPWLKESWNLTEQGRIIQRDPALARRLAAAAGAKIPALAD